MISKNFNPFNDVVKEAPRRHTTMKEMLADERPREKMLAKGVQALTVPELLAVIIGGGNTEQTAVELMQSIMQDCENSLICLSRMTVEDLMQYKGIGEARALSIVAAAEIGRRRSEEKLTDIMQLASGQAVHQFMQPKIQDLDHEESWVILLNNNMRQRHLLCIGTQPPQRKRQAQPSRQGTHGTHEQGCTNPEHPHDRPHHRDRRRLLQLRRKWKTLRGGPFFNQRIVIF